MEIEHVFKEGDAGATVEVAVGKSFAVELPENPTTGYRWSEPELDATSAAAESDDFEAGSGQGAGGGGVRRFVFHVKSPGKTAIHLSYRRKWEAGKDAARQFDLNVIGTP